MKKFYRPILTGLLLFSSIVLFSQSQELPIRFSNGDFISGYNVRKQTFKKEDIANVLFDGKYYVTIQFSILPSADQKTALSKTGIDLLNYLPGKAYLATIASTYNFSGLERLNIVSINAMPLFYKIDSRLSDYRANADKKIVRLFAIEIYPTINTTAIKAALHKAGATITPTKFDNQSLLFIQPDKSVINAVAALPFVSRISLQTITDQPLNYNSVAAHGVSGLNAPGGKNLNGKGVTIGVGDNSDISTHIDFAGRLINRNGWIPVDHGTHTSGTAAGAGIINVKNHGMAPRATIVSQFFSDVIIYAPVYVADNNLVLTNNSYHTAEAACAGEGGYDAMSVYADWQLRNYPELLHVVSAGNDGYYTCSPYAASFATVKSGWQCAKNVLTVGAINKQNYSIADFSSRGPVVDGRLKPEIVSGGWAILSTNTNNTYGINYGTSMASPAVTGSMALMYERYRQLNGGANPKGALMKALVCNTAEDLGNAGPDYTFGFGMLNTRRAVEAIDSNRYFSNAVINNGTQLHTITVPENARRLKVLLYWQDVESSPTVAATLVNDLDLTVTEPGSAVHQPLILNPAAAAVNTVAVEGADHVNNIEQVIIDNPEAGNYNITVAGFNVPFGPQNYFISYEILQPSVTVEYPCSGETFAPGDSETIRWTAYGNESNTFKVEYSIDNGDNWSTIAANAAANARSIGWTVPATVTNTALVRVTRNNTGLSGQSLKSFVILGSPVVTGTNVCEGSIQLKWNSIDDATDYNILQLNNDTMKVVGNTTDTSFLITGLSKTTTYWLGVAAKNGTVSGRRSVSVSMLPNGGACTLDVFNNDLKVDSILEPNTARQYFTAEPNAKKPVKIVVRNTGSIAVNGPYNLSYNYGAATLTETSNVSIPAGGTVTYTFTSPYTIPSTGYSYRFKAWVTQAADLNHANDTAYKTVKFIANPAVTLPSSDNFESMAAADFTKAEMAIAGNNRIDFSANTSRGRARTFVNTGFAYSGTKAITLDQTPFNAVATVDSLTFTYNLLAYAPQQLRLDFYYRNHGQTTGNSNKVWIRGSETNVWLQAYDLLVNQEEVGQWKHAIININNVLRSVLPAQTFTRTFQVKIGEEGNSTTNTATPISNIDDGYTIDDFTIKQATNDVALLKINSPDKSACALSATTPIGITVKNFNNVKLSNIVVSYQVNGGDVVTETIDSLSADQSLDYVFNQTADLSAYIDYSINVWAKYAGDNYALNDSLLDYQTHNSPLISTYPYLESFETNNGYFYSGGTNSSWDWGTPIKTIISKAANGNNAWVTNLSGNYIDNELSYLYTPCFDIRGLSKPVLSFSHIFSTELDYDYNWVEYTNDGVTWQKLGIAGSGTNWYDNGVPRNWRLSRSKWHVASIDIPVTGTTIRFRFVMSSDGGVTDEGIGIDDVRVHEKSFVAESDGLLPVSSTGPWDNSWVSFNSSGQSGTPYVMAEINARGQDLGTVTVTPYVNTGAVRINNNQYYLDRNYVINTTKPPTAPVAVRLYFKDAESEALINAGSCSTCIKPNDAYELGVSKYSGRNGDENNLLEDDSLGFFQFFSPVVTDILPHGNGYYAEFSVNNFSEFWFGKQKLQAASNGKCPGTVFTFSSDSLSAATYQWQVNTGTSFVNLSNSVNYTGVTTKTLQLANISTSFTGYKYRCIANGIPGREIILRFATVWTGAVNTNWFTAGNWSCNVVPDQYTDVTVPGGLTNYPIAASSPTIRSLSMYPGASVRLTNNVILNIRGK